MGRENLEKIFRLQHVSLNKEGSGFGPSNGKKAYKNFFVKKRTHMNDKDILESFEARELKHSKSL